MTNIQRFACRAIASMGSAAVLLVGCGLSGDEPAPVPSVAWTLKQPKVESEGSLGKFGGMLSYAVPEEPKTFNPLQVEEGYTQQLLTYVFDGLAEDHGLTGKLQPALAENWSLGKDNQTLTFTLREALQWSDGKPVTADDVVFTFQLVSKPGRTTYDDTVAVNGQMPVVEKLDPRRVRFRFPAPELGAFSAVATLPIVPKHALGGVLAPDAEPDAFHRSWRVDADVKRIVGTGPFTISAYHAGEKVVLARNPYYWRVNSRRELLPYLNKVVVYKVPAPELAYYKFRQGEFDLLAIQPADYVAIRKEGGSKLQIFKDEPYAEMPFIVFNLRADGLDPVRQKWLQNKRFRQAIAYALDQQSLIRNFQFSLGEPEFSVERSASWYFNPKARRYSYDLAKAEALLHAAGFRKEGGTLRDPAGHAVGFPLYAPTQWPLYPRVADMLAADLGKLGINVTVETRPWEALLSKLETGKGWEVMIFRIQRAGSPGSTGGLWHSRGDQHYFRIGTGQPETPWEKELDGIFEKASVTWDDSKRKALYNRYQVIAMEELPIIPFPDMPEVLVVAPQVRNIRFSSLGHYARRVWNIWEIYEEG